MLGNSDAPKIYGRFGIGTSQQNRFTGDPSLALPHLLGSLPPPGFLRLRGIRGRRGRRRGGRAGGQDILKWGHGYKVKSMKQLEMTWG